MRVRGMVAWRRASRGHGFNPGTMVPGGFVYHSNITGEGFRTLKGAAALVTIKQLARQA
jgi:cold shock CspA family protein